MTRRACTKQHCAYRAQAVAAALRSTAVTESKTDPAAEALIASHPTLGFTAWYQEGVTESDKETARVRVVTIAFYTEDGSLAVHEPATLNSGLPQRKVLMRHKVRLRRCTPSAASHLRVVHPSALPIDGAGAACRHECRRNAHNAAARLAPYGVCDVARLARWRLHHAVRQAVHNFGLHTRDARLLRGARRAGWRYGRFGAAAKPGAAGGSFPFHKVDRYGAPLLRRARRTGCARPCHSCLYLLRYAQVRETGMDSTLYRGRKLSPVKRYMEASRGSTSAVLTRGIKCVRTARSHSTVPSNRQRQWLAARCAPGFAARRSHVQGQDGAMARVRAARRAAFLRHGG